MRESDIMHEKGSYWVGRQSNAYTVYKNGLTHSTSDSSYKKDPDGLSIAIARCNYLAKREEEKAKAAMNLGESVKIALDAARTKHGDVYSVRYVHAISPSMKDTGGDIILPAGAFSNSRTLAKALRDRAVLLIGGTVKNFRVEGDKVIVFPGKNSTGGPSSHGMLSSNWHSIILTHVSEK